MPVGEQSFTLHKGMTGERCLWGIASADLERLGSALGWRKRPDDMMALRAEMLRQHFVGNPSTHIHEIRKHLKAADIPSDSDAILSYPHATAELPIGNQIFILSKIRNEKRYYWGIALADKKRLGQALGWKEKDPEIERFWDNMMVLSVHGLDPHFVGNLNTHIHEIRKHLKAAHIPSDSDAILSYPHATAELPIGDYIFTLHRGFSGSRCCWGIALDDKAKFAEALGFKLKG